MFNSCSASLRKRHPAGCRARGNSCLKSKTFNWFSHFPDRSAILGGTSYHIPSKDCTSIWKVGPEIKQITAEPYNYMCSVSFL